MALLAKMQLISYPEAEQLTDVQEKILVEELQLNLLNLAFTDANTQKVIRDKMEPTVREVTQALITRPSGTTTNVQFLSLDFMGDTPS